MYCLTMLFAKASILLEWCRLFVPFPTRNTFYWICHGMILANTMLYVAGVVATHLACTPREKIWHRWIPGNCTNESAIALCIASFNVVLNILILLLPHRVIWRLRLSNRQKTGISLIFSMGIVYVLPYKFLLQDSSPSHRIVSLTLGS